MYQEFVNKAIFQDKRNIFEKYNGDLSIVPSEIIEFYREHDPVDVEIIYKSYPIRFAPAKGLEEMMSEYGYLNAELVIASCNGDPIFIKDGKVFTCPHGTKNPKSEKIAESFGDFLKSIINCT